MARCYSDGMRRRQPSLPSKLPSVWLISDARNDAVLERVLQRLPRGSGFVYRHYHLDPAARRARFECLKRIAKARGHVVILSGGGRWGADGSYGPPGAKRSGLCLMTAHSLREIARCRSADAILLSPVFPTRSHPAAKVLGPLRFRSLAARSAIPVIALGGMNARRARRLRHPRWAAIDGVCDQKSARISEDS